MYLPAHIIIIQIERDVPLLRQIARLNMTCAPNEAWQISANCAEGERDPMSIDEPVFQSRAGPN
jgi:hypothetical protein